MRYALCVFCLNIGMVFDDQGIDHKDDILSDVRGVVGNSFKASGYDYQVDGPRNGLWIGHHIGEEFSNHLIV
jgi:hypothetical protein